MRCVEKTKILFALGIALVCCGAAYWCGHSNGTYESVWGEVIETKGFSEVVDNFVMQRLKFIDQAGAARYLGPTLPAFSRFDHSIGVFNILKKAGASQKELIAGILHDASHTVFSHVGDYIWIRNINDYSKESFQDFIHMKYLRSHGIYEILKSYNLTLEDIDINKNNFLALEQPLPDMCADRIQYNIHTGVILNRISKEDAKAILADLKFKDGKWFFSNAVLAEKFADLSLYFTQNFWGAAWNTSMNIHFAKALRRALDINIITLKDLFSTDEVVLNTLIKNQDRIIQLNLQQCRDPLKKMIGQKYDYEHFEPKFRGIDPLVFVDGKLHRLTELNELFSNHYNSVKKWCKEGFDVAILKS